MFARVFVPEAPRATFDLMSVLRRFAQPAREIVGVYSDCSATEEAGTQTFTIAPCLLAGRLGHHLSQPPCIMLLDHIKGPRQHAIDRVRKHHSTEAT